MSSDFIAIFQLLSVGSLQEVSDEKKMCITIQIYHRFHQQMSLHNFFSNTTSSITPVTSRKLSSVHLSSVTANEMSPFQANMLKRLKPSRETSSGSELPIKKAMCKNAEYPPHEFQPGVASTVADASLDDHAAYQARGHDLLEDWPRCDFSSRSRNASKNVTISETSKLRFYNVHKTVSQEWYSSKDRQVFQAEAVCEAFRIRELIAVASEGGNTRGKATMYLVERNLLSPEEMLGIEDLITGVASARHAFKERRLHTALVLTKQRELREKNERNIANKLAEVATSRSLKNVERARLRAALAAPNKFDRDFR
jgi:hypothetical protein